MTGPRTVGAFDEQLLRSYYTGKERDFNPVEKRYVTESRRARYFIHRTYVAGTKL